MLRNTCCVVMPGIEVNGVVHHHDSSNVVASVASAWLAVRSAFWLSSTAPMSRVSLALSIFCNYFNEILLLVKFKKMDKIDTVGVFLNTRHANTRLSCFIRSQKRRNERGQRSRTTRQRQSGKSNKMGTNSVVSRIQSSVSFLIHTRTSSSIAY